MVQLWRDIPLCEKQSADVSLLPEKNVFPSGRQALTAVLNAAGLGRADRIALPEWSSHCVISAAGKIVTPLPFQEVITHDIPVSAVLLYEQWGWPFVDSIHARISEKFSDTLILLDCVDSANVEQQNRFQFYPESGGKIFVVYSLSKLLGLKGGGVARTKDGYLSFSSKISSQKLNNLIWASSSGNDIYQDLLHFHKGNIEFVHHSVTEWLGKYDIVASLQVEADNRRDNLKILEESDLAQCWPKWMHDVVVREACAPGIAPLGYGKSRKVLQDYGQHLLERYDIETAIYNFNWSGNPFETDYGRCLAFPVHGQLATRVLQEIVSDKQRRL